MPFIHDNGKPCIYGWGGEDGNRTIWHCPDCCPDCSKGKPCSAVCQHCGDEYCDGREEPTECPEAPVECCDCHKVVPRDECTFMPEPAEWVCILCVEKSHDWWLNYFGGLKAIRRAVESERFYRDEGLLREDGTWDVDAMRKLKR